MMIIDYCPSTLAEGFHTYSPAAIKQLFDGQSVSHILNEDDASVLTGVKAGVVMRRISVSGAQEKFPAVVDGGSITKRFDIKPDLRKTEMEDFASLVGRNEQTDGKYFKYSGCYEDIAHAIKKFIPAWMVDMERFFDLVTFNYIYANGDDHLKNFSVIRQGSDLRLAPAYDLLNTSLHVEGDDFGLDGGLSPHLEKSDIYENTGHPCREDFEKFGALIGLPPKRVNRILNRYMSLPELTKTLTTHSFLNEKMKRSYLRIVNERIARFNRQ